MGRPFLAYIILPVWPGPLSLLSQGRVHTKPRHWIHAWASSNMRVAIEKQTHTTYGHYICQDLYSAYCPTGRCIHHPPFCLSLSTARLFHLMYALVYKYNTIHCASSTLQIVLVQAQKMLAVWDLHIPTYRLWCCIVTSPLTTHATYMPQFQEWKLQSGKWSMQVKTCYMQFNRNVVITTELVTTSSLVDKHQPNTSPTDLELTTMQHVLCSSHHTPYNTHYDLLIEQASKCVVAIMTRYYLVSTTEQYAYLYRHM